MTDYDDYDRRWLPTGLSPDDEREWMRQHPQKKPLVTKSFDDQAMDDWDQSQYVRRADGSFVRRDVDASQSSAVAASLPPHQRQPAFSDVIAELLDAVDFVIRKRAYEAQLEISAVIKMLMGSDK